MELPMCEKTSAREKDNQIKTLIIMAHNETLCAGKINVVQKKFVVKSGFEPPFTA